LQNLALAVTFGAAAGLGLYCALLFAGLGLLAAPTGLLVSLVILIALGRLSGKETPAMPTNTSQFDDGWTAASIVAALVLPFALAATMILAQGSHDPNSAYAETAADVAAAPTRWAAAYLMYALSLGAMVVALQPLGRDLRAAGATWVGNWAAPVFVLAAALLIAARHGAGGVGLALVSQSGGSGEDYLRYQSDESLVALLAAIAAVVAGLCLVSIGLAIWRHNLLAGRARVVASVGFVILGVALGLSTGWATGGLPASWLLPFAAAAGFWPFAYLLRTAGRATTPGESSGGPVNDGLPSLS
jgi:hypothetical protein